MNRSHLFPAAALVAAAAALLPASVAAQCILANPSFEVGASGSQVFGGWNQFGPVGETGDADHGARAALVRGPNAGGWDVAGFWQRQDCAPGQTWRATGHVRHPSSSPLAGQSVALVNVEWRDAAGDLVDYDSFPVASSSSPGDTWLDFDVTTSAAPSGTAALHLLLAVLQAPGDPVPEVHYDQVTLDRSASLDANQWGDFPGGTTLTFADRTWRVKGPGYFGPGPNVFSDDSSFVWVDADGLHLTLQNDRGTWVSTEVVLDAALGYGDYVVTTVGRLDQIDPQVVLGLFLWQYGPCWDPAYLWWNAFNEVDIEYSRWGTPWRDIGQFVAQPFDHPGNIERFDATFADGEVTSHAMRWLPDRVEYRAWRGGPADEATSALIHAWTYDGPHLPRPEQPRLHLNLWRHDGEPATEQEVVFRDFTFVPMGATATAVSDDAPPATATGRLRAPAPNPFNPRTTVAFDLDRAGAVRLAVYDVAGRHVRTLHEGHLAAGEHGVVWDGRDEAGGATPSGVYLVRLVGEGFVESRRATLAR